MVAISRRLMGLGGYFSIRALIDSVVFICIMGEKCYDSKGKILICQKWDR